MHTRSDLDGGSMNHVKRVITLALAAALLAIPALALAHGNRRGHSADRDHDRMADKWERRHHLNTHVNDARKDPDHDGLRNLSEFRHHTDPHKADTDDDGINDRDEIENEVSGTVVSFQNNVLTIQLKGAGAGMVVGAVNGNTKIECEDEDDDAQAPTATKSDDGGDDHGGDNSGPGSESSGGDNHGDDNDDQGDDNDDQGDDNDDQGENEDEDNCTTADLKQGAVVKEAKFVVLADNSKVFTKIELVPAV
jgi:hypothetical protein